MKLEFFGAAAEVTGSCHILHVGRLIGQLLAISGDGRQGGNDSGLLEYVDQVVDGAAGRHHRNRQQRACRAQLRQVVAGTPAPRLSRVSGRRICMRIWRIRGGPSGRCRT